MKFSFFCNCGAKQEKEIKEQNRKGERKDIQSTLLVRAC
jgi:hypothetical protein